MKVGSIIKAFDFPGRTDCFFLGKVTSVKNSTITAKILMVVSEGKDITSIYADEPEFCTPVQGASFMDDKFERIVVIG